MPQLSQRNIDGHYQAIAAGFSRAPAFPVPRRKDLYRLPQGHRAPSARHARRSRLAIVADRTIVSGAVLQIRVAVSPRIGRAWLMLNLYQCSLPNVCFGTYCGLLLGNVSQDRTQALSGSRNRGRPRALARSRSGTSRSPQFQRNSHIIFGQRRCRGMPRSMADESHHTSRQRWALGEGVGR